MLGSVTTGMVVTPPTSYDAVLPPSGDVNTDLRYPLELARGIPQLAACRIGVLLGKMSYADIS